MTAKKDLKNNYRLKSLTRTKIANYISECFFTSMLFKQEMSVVIKPYQIINFITASFYDLRYARNLLDFSDEDIWNGLKGITPDDLVSGSLIPVEGGQKVIFSVSTDLFLLEDNMFFAMRSSDNLNQTSKTSAPFKLMLDVYPPNRVDNFKAELNLATVAISFTAPGDDSDRGIGNNLSFHLQK